MAEKTKDTLMSKLLTIQQKLNAPKNLRNNFGGYNYRSCESILEAVKPLLAETKTVLVISDEVVGVGERNYIKAIASLYDTETGDLIHWVSALARESDSKKGMDDSQLTGATSSYARKYALNGLFAIDDNKDADATNTHGKEVAASATNTLRVNEIASYINNCNTRDDLEMLWSSLSEMEMKNQQIRDMFSNAQKTLNK